MVRLFLFLLIAIPLTGCNEVELQSQWRSKPISRDGSDADWRENAQYFEEDSRVLVSIVNDDDNIYVRLATRSQATKMLFLRAGFTLWIDDTGGTRKKFGIQFPLAKQEQRRGTMLDHKPRAGMQDMLEDSQLNLAILNGAKGNRQTMSTTKATEMGIYARLGMKQGYLLYQLKIPQAASQGNKTIGVGFETGKMERRPSSGGRGGMGSGGGGGKMMRGKGGSPGGGPSGRGRPEPFEMWAKIQLADISTRTR